MLSPRHFRPEIGLLFLAAVLMLTGLGSNSIHNADEARYSIVVDEMMERGDFADFTLRGEPYFNKAPLRIEMTHGLALLFGLSPWTLRLPSAFMGMIAVGLVMALGRRFFGAAAGRWAGLVLLTSTQFLYIHGSRSGEMDSTLLAFWLAALLAAVLAREHPAALWWCALLVGLSGLVKHIAYVVPVGGTVVLWMLMSGDGRQVGWRRLVLAGLAAVLIPLPWHAWQLVLHGSAFLQGYLGREVVERVADDYQGGYGWMYYLSVIKDGMFAWSLLLPFAGFAALRSPKAGRLAFFLAIWTGLMVAGLMLAQGDLSWYVMPALPGLALLVGAWIARTDPGPRAMLAWMVVALVFAVSPSNVGVWDVHRHFAIEGLIVSDLMGSLQGARFLWPQVLVAGLMLVGTGIWWSGRRSVGRSIVVGSFAVFAVGQAAWPLGTAFQRSDLDLLSEQLAGQDLSGGVVAWLPGILADNSVVYLYLERAADDVEVHRDAPVRDPGRWWVARREDVGNMELPPSALATPTWIALPPVTP